ncbi:hypothetical protein ACFO4O_15340 [Glaciecola siphonariae]|uniref:Uncharacterized protein n=1 Tax=Glaciecola siphonariae TaxID=521012 RepID=A0ABV9M0D7_9ALTE
MVVYSHLEKLRASFDSIPLELRVEAIKTYEAREIEIDSKLYIESVWIDQVGTDQILIVQIQKIGFTANCCFCLGSKFLRNDNVEHLSNEQLWDLGIP